MFVEYSLSNQYAQKPDDLNGNCGFGRRIRDAIFDGQ